MQNRPLLPTVIIPVFNAVEELESCLLSVLNRTPSGTEIIVIDDASSDERVRQLLNRWKRETQDSWRFVFLPQNRGFVQTANHGMQLTGADVVVLNSDTVVTTGWLQGLARCLSSDRRIATATPWTNNGEIASIPGFCEVNPPPSDEQAVARVIADSGHPGYPDLPTAVGFCMAISRNAIDRLGYFDAETFGRGYGEENDFSMRARSIDMRNVLCDDVYIVHLGGRSFRPLGMQPDESAMHKLLSMHPDYLTRVQAFIESDPLAGRRGELLRALQQAGVDLC